MAKEKDNEEVYVLNDEEMERLYDEFAHRLVYLRERDSATQYALAKALRVKQPTISGYETGLALPTIPTLLAMSRYFDVPVDYLLGRGDFHLKKRRRRRTKKNEPEELNAQKAEEI